MFSTTAQTQSIPTTTATDLTTLRTQVQDRLIQPGDAAYDQARQAWNLTVNQHPALIVVAHTANDVAAAVQYANQVNLPVAVQSTGHGLKRAADGALLIITTEMQTVTVDEQRQTAWVAAGVKWGAVLAKAQAAGLAPLLGSSPHVGVVGYTLGGGLGWLARQYGLAADSVNYFEVVTADGQIRRVSRFENADLFWGLRGGGGSLAVITGLEIKLYPVTTVYAGNLLYPASMAKGVLRRYREWISTAPDELTSSVVLMNFPPIPQVPEHLRGQSFVMVRGCYTGPVEQGEALIRSWLNWREPLANLWHAMPFAEAATISNDPVAPMAGYSSGGWLRDLSDEAIETLIRFGVNQQGSSPLTLTEVRHVGGAIARVNTTASPIGHRTASFVLAIVAGTPTAELYRLVEQHVQGFKQELAPAMAGVYMNFVDGEEARARTREAYSVDTYHELMRLKAKYDPANRFDHAFNIPPAKPMRFPEPTRLAA